MKKATLIACAAALVMGVQGIAAQEAKQEITYVSDPSQGVLLNNMKDNWFITAEGGANLYAAPNFRVRGLNHSIKPNAGLYIGKWFSPVFGARIGVNYTALKSLQEPGYKGEGNYGKVDVDGAAWNKNKHYGVGPQADLLVNLSNWFCGYNPDRFYNGIIYAGGNYYWNFVPNMVNGQQDGVVGTGNDLLSFHAGYINSFRLTKNLAATLDLNMRLLNAVDYGMGGSPKTFDFQAAVGLTYNLGKSTWEAPVVPVCPEPENCDAYRARLAAADARIADLEVQLRNCMERPVEVAAPAGPVATVYFPIGVSRLNRENTRVVKAIAYVMTQSPEKSYTLTGWADNYTGSEAINNRLRKNRAESVKKVLVKNGVAADRLTVTTNKGNLSDLGEKCVALDRAVTIDENK